MQIFVILLLAYLVYSKTNKPKVSDRIIFQEAKPSLLIKLANKYGAGTLYKNSINLLDGFTYVLISGKEIPLTMKELLDLSLS